MANEPLHRSFSQLTAFQQCMHRYYLSKVMGVTENPAVYLAAGTAVHSAIEKVNHLLFEANAG